MPIYLADCTNVLLSEIGDKDMTQRAIALTYRLAMLSEAADVDAPDWRKINAAIIERWSMSGLERVKKLAWRPLRVTVAA